MTSEREREREREKEDLSAATLATPQYSFPV